MMELVSPVSQDQLRQLRSHLPASSVLKDKIFVPRNQAERMFGRLEPLSWLACVQPVKTDGEWNYSRHGSEIGDEESVQLMQVRDPRRVNVLMNTSMIDEKWCRPMFAERIEPWDKVCVVAMSYFDDTKTLRDWNVQYGKGQGIWYRANTDVFFRYGLKEEQVFWINPFEDSRADMVEKICAASILMLPGGAPELFIKRLRQHHLGRLIRDFQGLVIGYSAGAMIQLDKYHIAPDEDYDAFSYQRGLGQLSGFDVEVHYRGSRVQKEAIAKVMQEKNVPVCAIGEKGALMIDENGRRQFYGDVQWIEAGQEDW